MNHIILRKFDKPDETRIFEKGKFELIEISNMVIGRATYKPGWRWSTHVSPLTETKFCEVEHLGFVLSGSASVAFRKEETHILEEGDLFYVPPMPHDSWVIGDEEYISLHFLGTEKYAR